MLTELHIENIAVIERADIEPGPGLNVLTGETGAGKSIVIDSLEAILGARASRELVRTGAQNAAVSAVFDDERAARWLVEHDLEPVGQYDPDTGEGERIVIRRRISAEGKSSALVNGENVTAAELRQLGALLLDIHGQNDGRQLMDETRHRDYLDGFAGLAPQLERQGRLYEEYRQALSALRKLEMTEAERERREREYRMTADELAAANIRPGEEEQLLARRELLRNSEKLTEALDAAYEALYGGEDSAAEQAGNASGWTERAASLAPELDEALAEIESARASIEDAAERLRDFRESLDFSPGEYDALETRLSQLRRLEKKYGADEAGLAALLEAAQRGLEELDGSEEKRRELEAELAKRKKAAYNSAKELSQLRRAAGEELRQRVEQGLRELSMPSVRFETELLDIPNFQGNAAVNYTDRETPWTRIIEHKWFEFGKDEAGNDLPKTVISREYSSEWKPGDEPYYPVNDEKNGALYAQYRDLAEQEKNVIFGGRLGEYKYYDMAPVIEKVIDKYNK